MRKYFKIILNVTFDIKYSTNERYFYNNQISSSKYKLFFIINYIILLGIIP